MVKHWTPISTFVYRGSLLFAVVCVCLVQQSGCSSQCKVSQCSDEFAIRQGYITNLSSTLQNCWALVLYKRCCEKQKSSCWTDLNFRFVWRGIPLKMANYGNCRNVGLPKDNLEDFYKTWIKQEKETQQRDCVVKTDSNHRFCAMFGDPHLWTFSADKQTCVIAGARSLIRNKFLAVQVTNVEVPGVPGSDVTATSKVTVVLYDYQNGCVRPKSYRATRDLLPSTFTDGSTTTGPEDSPAQIHQAKWGDEKYIKIKIKYISTTIIIRQINISNMGKYLTFSMLMPNKLIGNSTTGLCVNGCPQHERIDCKRVVRERAHSHGTATKAVKMIRRDAERICKSANTTGFYFSSCLFDLMTTGNVNFSRTASSAMQDAIDLNVDVSSSDDDMMDYEESHVELTKRTSSLASKHDSVPSYLSLLTVVLVSLLHVWR